MKVRNNVYLLSGGMYGQLGNVWLVKHENGCILFDCGRDSAFATIQQNLSYWGFSLQDITHVFLTHGHDDHAGCSSLLQKAGAKIVVGEGDACFLEQGGFGEKSPFLNHTMPSCRADLCLHKDTHFTIGGVEIDAYEMRGHSNGSYLYYVKTKEDSILFTGDMFNVDGEKGNIVNVWWKGDLNYNSRILGESFKRLWELQLTPSVICGGHGICRIGEDAKDVIMLAYKEYLLHHR